MFSGWPIGSDAIRVILAENGVAAGGASK